MARLHIDRKHKLDEIISDIEQDIADYIFTSATENFDNVLKIDKRFEVFYHFTQMRKSLFNWYEFDQEGTLLEIGGEFGALTGLFCDKCKRIVTLEASEFRAAAIAERYRGRNNLDVYAYELENLDSLEQFDYIVLVGGLEYAANGIRGEKPYRNYLMEVLKYLKPQGHLLVAVENRFGLRYFCGAEEPHTKKPFHGIQKYPGGFNGYSFSRQELDRIIKQAGIISYKFYYPLPDYKFPQLIYSQDYLPKESISERLMPYYLNKEPLVAIEKELYDDMVDNNVFEFFSNSFLVECMTQKETEFCSVLYAALSTDRGEENAFITAVHKNGIVTKRPVYPAGEKNARAIRKNMEELELKGIDIVKHEWKNHMIVMPQIKADTLCSVLRENLYNNKERFIGLIDELYGCILKSSEHISIDENYFIRYDQNADWGIILKRAYIDMIPINCFYRDSKMYFYDQEFTRDCFPAGYVLYRALKYTYIFIPDANKLVPLDFLRKKYGLAELWNFFEKEEGSFIAQNRNYDIYSQFMKWSEIDRKKVHKKAETLLRNE